MQSFESDFNNTKQTKLYGLIGYPLEHSFSQKYFTTKFTEENIGTTEYKLYPIKNISELPSLIESLKNLRGLSVTTPYKESVIEYLDEIDPTAKQVGAVNTIKIIYKNKKTHLAGFNTDIFGFEKSFTKLKGIYGEKALVLGTGGASKAVGYVLRKLNIQYLNVSRKPKNKNEISYSDIDDTIIKNHKLLINTTPLGMYPDVKSFPAIPFEAITKEHILYDLVYNPDETEFLKKGKAQGAVTKNGLEMLISQAEKSWEIWNRD
ncbi:MAG: shikimate dehydrogenase [Bacteroidetes bacterium]|nr:shikimate dehydrogenase [Bacteroidota bacterium]